MRDTTPPWSCSGSKSDIGSWLDEDDEVAACLDTVGMEFIGGGILEVNGGWTWSRGGWRLGIVVGLDGGPLGTVG